MKYLLAVLSIGLGCLHSPVGYSQQNRSNHDYLKPMEPFIGQWKMAGEWGDGIEFVGEESSAWMLDKSFIRTEGWFRDRLGKRVDYHIITGWDPIEKQIVETFTFSGGGYSKRVCKFDEANRVLTCKERGADGDGRSVSFDLEMRFEDNDQIAWKATNFKEGEETLPDLTFTFERVASDASSDSIPEDAIAALQFFVGSWTSETFQNGVQAGTEIDDRRWLDGGHAVLMQTRGTENGKQIHGSGISGWDAKERRLVEYWYSSDGLSAEVRYPLSGMQEDAWSGDFSVTFGDGREFDGDCVLKKTPTGFEWHATWLEDGKQMERRSITKRVK